MSSKQAEKKIPTLGNALSAFPVGCCVLIDGETGWDLVSMRLGGRGDPHCRRLLFPPSSTSWMEGALEPRQVVGTRLVVDACWPVRKVDDSTVGSVKDPVLSPADGGTR